MELVRSNQTTATSSHLLVDAHVHSNEVAVGVEHACDGLQVMRPEVEIAELEDRAALEPPLDEVVQRVGAAGLGEHVGVRIGEVRAVAAASAGSHRRTVGRSVTLLGSQALANNQSLLLSYARTTCPNRATHVPHACRTRVAHVPHTLVVLNDE